MLVLTTLRFRNVLGRVVAWTAFAGLLSCGWGMSAQNTVPSNTARSIETSGAALLKADLLGVFAHPDDETGVAPLLAHYALGQGKRVAAVYCTRGEGGGNMIGTQGGKSLGLLREVELRQCLAMLGVGHCVFLDQEDFAYTESLVVTLQRWGHERSLERLVRVIRALRPDVVVTMNPAPTPGQHGHHQAAGWLAVEAFSAAADPEWFPHQLIREGLDVWQVRKLYFAGTGPCLATIDASRALPDGRDPAGIAGQALSHHRSQGFGGMAGAPWLRRPQLLQLVQSVVPFQSEETDLFRGLPLQASIRLPEPQRPPDTEPAIPENPIPVRFVPRPAVERYEDFVRRHGIEHAATRLHADIPVVAGEPSPVPLEILDTAETPAGVLKVQAPEGWGLRPEEVSFGGEKRRDALYRILEITPPETGVPISGEPTVTVAGTWQGKEIRASARLHVVPRLGVPKLNRALKVVADEVDASWSRLAATTIHSHQVWQGQVRDEADSSAVFRLAHDGRTLFIEVRVRDDVVVSNLEPNDIQAHWRTDSVEICVDPQVGAEHTLEAFKLGVIPFDRSGRVRAARDADARPGPVDKDLVGLELVSWRTAEGYALRLGLPLSWLGVDLSRNRRVGFNLLIYDGDKEDAAPGENINKSRLAWAPRSGIQGRPEDWGRLDFE